VVTTISGEGGQPPRIAVPDFIALSKDAETVAMAKQISQVLFDDLVFEREFSFIPRDVYASIPAATSLADIPFDRWRELNADGLVIGTVEKTGNGFKVDARLFQVRTRRQTFGKEYSGTANGRLYAHHVADDLHASAKIAQDTWVKVRDAFSEEQILEIVMLAGQYRGVSYLVNATGMELEETALRFPSKDE